MSNQFLKDKYFMSKALEEAKIAFQKDEIPVGAIITIEDKIISRAYNMTEQLNDVTAHAEMLAITSASNLTLQVFSPTTSKISFVKFEIPVMTVLFPKDDHVFSYNLQSSCTQFSIVSFDILSPETLLVASFFPFIIALLQASF